MANNKPNETIEKENQDRFKKLQIKLNIVITSAKNVYKK